MTGTEEKSALDEVMNSGIFVHGKKTNAFEANFCSHFGYDHAVSVANCTAGLHLAHHSLTKAMDPATKKQHNVLCPAMTHVATAHAIELAGLTPLFVDCLAEDGNIDVQLMESKITDKTVGIAAMHFNGVPCDIVKIMEIALKHDLYVVEDCAISLGAKVDGKPVGTFGNAGAFSFHPVKQMTTGEGGMIVTNDESFKSDLVLERAFGVNRIFSDRKTAGLYDVTKLGFNYRLAELPAAIGVEQLKKVDGFNERRKANFITLKEAFSKISGIKVRGGNITPDRTYYCLIAELENSDSDMRNELISKLKENEIQTSIYYPHPLPRLKYYSEAYTLNPEEFPNALTFSDKCIAFPVAPHLSRGDMILIADTLKGLLK